MWPDRRLLDLLGIEHPIIQAPMAGAASPELVAAVSHAGALGSYGAAATPPERLRDTVLAIRQRTDRPFNVNLFSPHTEQFDRAARPGPRLSALLQGYHGEYGLGAVPEPGPLFGPAETQLAVLLEQRVPVVSFHFGADPALVARAHAHGARVLCSATTVAEARLLVDAGVDAVIAQGTEAGGHRGTFASDYRSALIGTLALVPQVVDAVPVPVIAAGGIMDARGIVACLALGAAGVQMGTAFLGCPEAPIAQAWREALLAAAADQTTVTRVLSGKPARGLRNRYVDEVEREVEGTGEPLLPYPAQYSVLNDLRAAAAERGDRDFLAMWSGQGVGLLHQRPAAELVRWLVSETAQLLSRISARTRA